MSHHHHKDKGMNGEDPVVPEAEVKEAAENAVEEKDGKIQWTEVKKEEADPKEPTAEEKLAAAETALEEARQKLLYLQADYQNYRKRTSREIGDARVLGTSNALSPFLTVYDFLGMAGAAAEKSDNIEAIRQGLKMIIGEFNKAFDELGVKKIETVGKTFDPELHEAVSRENHDTAPEGEILKEWAGGFKLGERLLRPARVVVSAGKKPEGEAPAPESQAEEKE